MSSPQAISQSAIQAPVSAPVQRNIKPDLPLQEQRPHPFSQFVHYVGPTPPPSRLEFYSDGFRRYFQAANKASNKRYYEELKKDRGKGLLVSTGIIALSLLLTAVSGPLRKLFHLGFLASLIVFPVMKTSQTLPKLAQAYDVIKEGNPEQGEKLFQLALGDLTYTVLHEFLTPISKAFTLTLFLSSPHTWRDKLKRDWLGVAAVPDVVRNGIRQLFRIPTPLKPGPGQEIRGVSESILCTILEAFSLVRPQGKTLTTHISEALSRLGWKAAWQPISLLFRFNNLLRQGGSYVEAGLRRIPGLGHLL